jgi:uncharacterized protein (DUF1778 family)
MEQNSKFLETDEDKEIFVNAIMNPPEPNDKLKDAQEKYKNFNNNNLKIKKDEL